MFTQSINIVHNLCDFPRKKAGTRCGATGPGFFKKSAVGNRLGCGTNHSHTGVDTDAAVDA